MTPLSSETLHASTVAINGRAVLIEGVSGAGKSDLALRLIDRGATLVSDDYTVVTRRKDGALTASPPATIAGRMEVRGIGILPLPHVVDVPVALIVRLAPPDRMPDPERRAVAGVAVPVIAVSGFEGSAPFKVELALARVTERS
jgi:serine kinase of HPr protein (carbohydrate metabolism regulator)